MQFQLDWGWIFRYRSRWYRRRRLHKRSRKGGRWACKRQSRLGNHWTLHSRQVHDKPLEKYRSIPGNHEQDNEQQGQAQQPPKFANWGPCRERDHEGDYAEKGQQVQVPQPAAEQHVRKVEVWQLLQESEWEIAEEDCEEAYARALRSDHKSRQVGKLVDTAILEPLLQLGWLWGARREEVHSRRGVVEIVVWLRELHPWEQYTCHEALTILNWRLQRIEWKLWLWQTFPKDCW